MKTTGPKRRSLLLGAYTLLGTALLACGGRAPSDSDQGIYRAEHLAMYQRYRDQTMPLGRAAMRQAGGFLVDPHWLADGNRFWYEDSRYSGRQPVHTTIYLVDPAANTVTGLFDPDRLRQAIRDTLGTDPDVEGIPFRQFEFTNSEETSVRFELEGQSYKVDLDTYEMTAVEPQPAEKNPVPGRCGTDEASRATPSPDGRWIACVLGFDVWLLSTETGQEEPVTVGGTEEYAWTIGAPPGFSDTAWAPDGSLLLLRREDRRGLPLVPGVRWLTDPPEIDWSRNGPGILEKIELHIFDPADHQLMRLDLGEPSPFFVGVTSWRPDASELIYETWKQAGLLEDILAVSPTTGISRLLHSETSDAPVLVGLEYSGQVAGTLLQDGDRLLYVSEDSGALQLYLMDLDGGPALQLTSGPYPVIRLVDVDEEEGWVYYTAFGDPERPYDAHFYRVRFDGSEVSRLTDLGANHEATGLMASQWGFRLAIQLSPSKDYFIARRSTPERLPVMELRRTDGALIRVLSEAGLGPLAGELRWTPPEEFAVKASDGVTDLWGVLWKPYDFDPARQYPVIEVFYDEMVQRTFDPTPHGYWADQLAQLGFITVMLEGRGATGRGRVFQNAFHGQPGAFVEDHAAAVQNLAGERPYMDLSRVGAFGYSAGGDDALWAMVGTSGTYHAGVSIAPTTSDSPEDNEALLASVPDLQGDLFLIHGTADGAAPIPLTMRFIDACIRAGKPIDMLLVPDGGHVLDSAWEYLMDRVRDFFLEHLDP